MGIEPTSSAWKAEVLPLNYTRRMLLPSNGYDKDLIMTAWLLPGGGGRIRTYEG